MRKHQPPPYLFLSERVPGPDLHCAVSLFLPGPSATQFLVKLSEVVNGHQSPGSCMSIWIMLYVGGPELRHSAVLGGGDKGALI